MEFVVKGVDSLFDDPNVARECRIHDIGRSRGQRPLNSLYLPGGFLST